MADDGHGNKNPERAPAVADAAGSLMKPKSGISLYLETLVVWVYTVLGALLVAAGLALLVYQAYLWVSLGIWGQVPASSLFVEPRIATERLPVPDDVKSASPQSQLPAAMRERIVRDKLSSVVPNWFRSNTSWLAKPQYLHGLHDVVIGILEFLSISGMLFLGGAFFIAVGLSKPTRKDDGWERREPTL